MKPVPATVAAVTTTAAVPEDVRVSDCVASVLTAILPKFMAVVLIVRAAVAGALKCKAKVLVIPPATAERVAV
jgi:hypothetical protein